MDERKGGCGVWCEERGVRRGIEADEGGEEGEGAGGEVEDVVGECFGGGEEFWGGRVGAVGMGFLGGYGYGGGGGGEVFGGVSDEGVAVFVEGADEGLDLGL